MKHLNSSRIKRGWYSLHVLALGFFLGGASPAWANIQLFDPLSTTTGINSNSQLFQGVYERNSNNTQSIPFTIQVYSAGGECLRLDVTSQPSDLEMVVVSPNGTVWRNDDFNGLLPVVRALTTVNGWYTVHISHFSGSTGAGVFVLRYGRYNSGNPNCSNPTPAL